MKGRSTLSRVLNLRTQLLVSHLLLVLVLGLVMSLGVGGFFTLNRGFERVLQENLRAMIAGQDIRNAIENESQIALNLMPTNPEDAAQQSQVELMRLRNALGSARESAQPSQEPVLASLDRELKLLSGDFEMALSLRLTAERLNASRTILEPTIRRMSAQAEQFLMENQAAINRESSAVKQQVRNASVWSLWITLIAVAFAIFLALRMVRVALTPLNELATRAERIGAGNLQERIRTRRKDEIGVLAQAFNNMAKSLLEARQRDEQRRIRAEAVASSALASLYDPVIISDAQGQIVHFNPAAEGIFGRSPDQPRAPIIEHLGDMRIVQAIQKAIRGEQTTSNDEDPSTIVPIKVGGTERTYRLRATPMRDAEGNTLGAVSVLEDITHLRELDRLKTEFIGVASHELRTPVTSLLLSTELLLEGATGELNATQKEVVAAQKEDLERLERLMRELLDLTRLEAGSSPPRFELVKVDDIVRGTMTPMRTQAHEKNVELSSDIPDDLPLVRADRSQIIRVLTNLVSNAVRHTPSGGSVKVSARAEGDQVRFRVSDTGEGIPTDYLPQIFERFVQVPGATGGGAGLGLPISQTIVHAHGGNISVESELGKGAAFEFALHAEPMKVSGEQEV